MLEKLPSGAADKGWVTDDVVDGYMAAAARDLGATLCVYKRTANGCEPEPLAPRLRQGRCPVRLLLDGVPHQRDANAAEVAKLQQALRSRTVERVPAVTHFIYRRSSAGVD